MEPFQPGTVLGAYRLSKVIGHGHFAVVYRAKHIDTRQLVALKVQEIYRMRKETRARCMAEMRMLARLKHPNIVRVYEDFMFENYLVIVSEYAELGDLKKLLESRLAANTPFTEAEIWKLFAQVVSAVRHIHEARMIHRDLKPSNILVTAAGVLKVSDLGLARDFADDMASYATSRVGTPLYMAPEVIEATEHYSYSSDVWSLGCILYELATGTTPFVERNLDFNMLKEKIKAARYNPLPTDTSSYLRRVIEDTLVLDPKMRPTIAELDKYCSDRVGAHTRPSEQLSADSIEVASELVDTLKLLDCDRACRVHSLALLPSFAWLQPAGDEREQARLVSVVLDQLLGRRASAADARVHVEPMAVTSAVREAFRATLSRDDADAAAWADSLELRRPYGTALCRMLLVLARRALAAARVELRRPAHGGGAHPSETESEELLPADVTASASTDQGVLVFASAAAATGAPASSLLSGQVRGAAPRAELLDVTDLDADGDVDADADAAAGPRVGRDGRVRARARVRVSTSGAGSSALDLPSPLRSRSLVSVGLQSGSPAASPSSRLHAGGDLFGLLESTVDEREWRAEAERVKARLARAAADASATAGSGVRAGERGSVRTGGRAMLQQCESAATEVVELLQLFTRAARDEVARASALDASVSSRLAPFVARIAEQRAVLAREQELVRERAERVDALSARLQELGDTLDGVRESLDAYSVTVGDAAPVKRVRAALQSLRNELGEVDVRLGAAMAKWWRHVGAADSLPLPAPSSVS